jgi:penicillin-binding protein A
VNRQLKRIGVVVLLLFGALFVNLNVISLLLADDLATHPSNRRLIVREYAIDRGPLIVGEDAIARSEETGGELRFLRTYPQGPRYAHLTGYYSVTLQRSGLEDALNEDLTGRPTEVVAQNLGELLGSSDRPGNAVQLTIDPAAQAAAEQALGDRIGAVVAIDPVTGAVLASYSNPTFDPNPLSSHDPAEIDATWEPLRNDPTQPLLDRTRQERYPPGSVFKLVVAAAALERGLQPDSAFPDERVYDVPQSSADIGNYGGGLCADGDTISLADAMRVSCNTVFARLGVQLGAEALVEQAERFGFNRVIPYELDVVPSLIPDADDLDPPATAQSSIGQRDVAATPMQLAVVAASIANGGQLVRPHVVAAVLDPSGRRLRGPEGAAWTAAGLDGAAISPRTADQLRDMMLAVVASGTGTRAQIDGVEVGGKTGTAEVPDGPPVTWFAGFAEQRVAIAVVVPGAVDDETGGRVATPIAREVMAAVLGGGS